MPTLEALTWIGSGVGTLIIIFVATIYKLLREEAKEHARQIELKASNDKLEDMEVRIEKDMKTMSYNNERLIEKLERRQEKDIEAVSAGFREQINGIKEAMSTMERNILSQIAIMFKASEKHHD